MTERIKMLTDMTLAGQMYVEPIKTEFDREDLLLSESQMQIKRICKYIANQKPKITQYSKLSGFFRFDGSVVGDAFGRSGHKATEDVMNLFYLKSIDNLSTMEWQHATADYSKVLNSGFVGIIKEIDKSLALHKNPEEIDFLNGLKDIANKMIAWADKCSSEVLRFSETVKDTGYKANLEKLSSALLNVPKNKPKDFYEAVLSIYVTFSLDPDSVGTLDRYLTPFYENDIRS